MIKTGQLTDSSAAEVIGGFILSLLAGYMLSDSTLAGAASFADISLAGALSLPFTPAVLTGSLIHSIAAGNVGRNIVKISSMIIVLIVKLFFDSADEPRNCGMTVSSAIFISGAAVSALIGEVLYKLLFYVFYGVISGFCAYSAALILRGFRKRAVIDLSVGGGLAYSVVYTVTVSALCSADIPALNAGIVIGSAVTIGAAYFYRSTGGVLCGSLTACGAFLASPEIGMTVVLLPAAGFIAGYFSGRRTAAAAFVFTVVAFMLMILTGMTENGIFSIINIASGSLLFIAVSPLYSDKWIITGSSAPSALPELMSARLGFLSDAIGEVRAESGRISELLTRKSDPADAAGELSRQVCTRCFRRLNCWKNNYDLTARGFRKLTRAAENAPVRLPDELAGCMRADDLLEISEELVQEKAMKKLLEMRFSESRSLLFEQIRVIEEMINSAGQRLDVRYSDTVSRQVSEKLRKFSIPHKSAIAYYNSTNRLVIELYFVSSESPDRISRICDLVSDELRISLSSAEPVDSGREVRVRLFEQPEYTIEVYSSTRSAGHAPESGDTSTVFSDGTGASYVILSDGMGSGRNAAVESRIVVRMFRKLVSSGVNCCSAIKLINSIMVTKSHEESFATLDALRIDLDTCEMTMIKSGAAATLISRRGRVVRVAAPTFPIGIYERSEAYFSSEVLEDGDIIIMCSDGISESEYLYIRELLRESSDVQHIVEETAAKSDVFNQNSRPDDVTVLGIRVKRTK
ncbi:MAG: SpoIIE family protein phosphatase [Ruminococcus sp.]|nr:SpoIIE family protein phosphatase [Ruminococcus sp.]